MADLDSHWFPVSLQCGLCRPELHYDLVIRMETLQEMWAQVSAMSGVSLPPLPHMNQAQGGSQGGDTILKNKNKYQGITI